MKSKKALRKLAARQKDYDHDKPKEPGNGGGYHRPGSMSGRK